MRAIVRIALVATLALAAGCSASDRSTAASPSSASSGGAATASSESVTAVQATESDDGPPRSAPGVDYSMSTSAATRSQSTTVPAARPAASGGAPEQATPMIARDDQIAQWQSRLAAIEVQLQASAGACRDVCRATDAICHASRELCSLTGDREGAPPTDPRCARARVSCERAARQRQENCTSCPSE